MSRMLLVYVLKEKISTETVTLMTLVTLVTWVTLTLVTFGSKMSRFF